MQGSTWLSHCLETVTLSLQGTFVHQATVSAFSTCPQFTAIVFSLVATLSLCFIRHCIYYLPHNHLLVNILSNTVVLCIQIVLSISSPLIWNCFQEDGFDMLFTRMAAVVSTVVACTVFTRWKWKWRQRAVMTFLCRQLGEPPTQDGSGN